MTKNRFLSKRLACLLTTALVSMPITLNKSYAADIATPTAANTGATEIQNFTADTTLTSTPSAARAFTLAITVSIFGIYTRICPHFVRICFQG